MSLAYDLWHNIGRKDRMLNQVFDRIALEQGLSDRSEAGKEAFFTEMKRKNVRYRRPTFGEMVRFQGWFQWQKCIRSELIPNWSIWLWS